MKKMILCFTFLFCCFAVSADDCIFQPSLNEMAKDWNEAHSSQTVPIENQWFYTASGTENASFTFAHDENFFEVKMLSDRHLAPYYKSFNYYDLKKHYYGPDWYGLETKIIRVHCPTTASSSLSVDPYNGLAICCGKEDSFYKVVGSSTILVIKKNRVRVKEVK